MRTRMMNRVRDGGQIVKSNGQRVVLLDLLAESHEVTLAQAAYKWRQIGDILAEAGPRLEGITVHTKLSDVTANFAFKVKGRWSLDGEDWTDFAADLAGPINANGSAITSEYTTLTDFGRYIRFELGTTDGGAVEHGIVSVMIALRFYQGA